MIESVENGQLAILERTFGMSGPSMSREVARFFDKVEISPDDLERSMQLAEKSRDGRLSAAEEQEIEEYRRIGRLIELLRIKARVALES